MISYYLEYSAYKLDGFFSRTKFRVSERGIHILVGAIFSLNFLDLSEFLFYPGPEPGLVSILGGLTVIGLIVLFFRSRKGKVEKMQENSVLSAIFIIHLIVTLMVHIYLVKSSWDMMADPSYYN